MCIHVCVFKSAFVHCILQISVGKEMDNYAHFIDVLWVHVQEFSLPQ